MWHVYSLESDKKTLFFNNMEIYDFVFVIFFLVEVWWKQTLWHYAKDRTICSHNNYEEWFFAINLALVIFSPSNGLQQWEYLIFHIENVTKTLKIIQKVDFSFFACVTLMSSMKSVQVKRIGQLVSVFQ